MPSHQIARQEQAADGRDDRCEQDTNRFFPVEEQTVEQLERAAQIPGRDGIAKLKDSSDMRNGNEQSNVLRGNLAALRTEIQIQLIQFGFDHAPVTASHQRNQLSACLRERQTSV